MQPQSRSGSDIAEAVLGAIGHERAIRLPLTFLAAFALHAAILLGVRHGMLGSHLPTSDTGPATKEDEFELAPLPPPERPAAVPERTTREHRAAFAKAPPSAVHAELPSGLEAARAAKVVAQVPESSTPVDLTADEVVTGTANAYAGGLTASTGTGTSAAGQAPAAPGAPRSTLSIALDRSGPVSLPTENWSCPWPSEADAEQIDEQTVILRVVVTATGDPESATILSDPGHGFGPAAQACAMRTHFTPARDPRGGAIRAISPPIRVRFTR